MQGLILGNFVEALQILDTGLKVFNTAIQLAVDDRRGGYFCCVDLDTGHPRIIAAFGEMPDEKASRYLTLSQEKGIRLSGLPEHGSSWQSRNEQESKFGGAIRAKKFIFSFSGLPELLDEALVLMIAVERRQLGDGPAAEIAQISNNHFFSELEHKRQEIRSSGY